MATSQSDRDTDSDRPPTPSSVDDLEALSYADKQSLAGANGYGRIVGVEESELENFLTDELGLREQREDTAKQSENADHSGDRADRGDSENSDRATSSPSDSDRQSDGDDSEPERETQTVSNTESTSDSTDAQTDGISVGHEGSEKLSPEGAPEDSGTAVAPPDGIDADDIHPDDLEPDQSSKTAKQSESSERSRKPEQKGQSDQSDDSDSGGGLVDRIKGGSDRSPDEIVEDADSEEERQRREEARETFAAAFGDDGDDEAVDDDRPDRDRSDSSSDPAPAARTQQSGGMVVDESVVEHLIGQPFNMAASMTGWEGWQLSQQEKAANAELFVAMCDEHDVDVGPTAMFALSMASTAGGRAMRYRQQQGDDGAVDDDRRDEASDQDVAEAVDGESTGQSGNQSESSEDGGFNFEEPNFGE